MRKLTCYVDETGLDPRSKFFLVSVVILEGEREEFVKELERIEKASLKGRRKWMETRGAQRLAYIQELLNTSLFKNRLHYSVYPQTSEYFSKTVLAIGRAIAANVTDDDYKAAVFIDGLPKSLIPDVGTALRHLHIRTSKVRGVRKEEADAVMRLADAICGFVRAALEEKDGFRKLLDQARERGFIREI